jgi:putative transposase
MSGRRHRKRFEGLNHARFLTCSCFRRRPFLDRDRSRLWLTDAIERARARHGFELWAWVVMPEHFHVLLFPEPGGAGVGEILSTVKQSVSKRALRWVERERPGAMRLFADVRPDGSVVHRFWQRGGGYDRNLWSAREVWEKIDYMHANPVARGLCEKPEDWPWSSAGWYRERRGGLLRIDHGRVPPRP